MGSFLSLCRVAVTNRRAIGAQLAKASRSDPPPALSTVPICHALPGAAPLPPLREGGPPLRRPAGALGGLLPPPPFGRRGEKMQGPSRGRTRGTSPEPPPDRALRGEVTLHHNVPWYPFDLCQPPELPIAPAARQYVPSSRPTRPFGQEAACRRLGRRLAGSGGPWSLRHPWTARKPPGAP